MNELSHLCISGFLSLNANQERHLNGLGELSSVTQVKQ